MVVLAWLVLVPVLASIERRSQEREDRFASETEPRVLGGEIAKTVTEAEDSRCALAETAAELPSAGTNLVSFAYGITLRYQSRRDAQHEGEGTAARGDGKPGAVRLSPSDGDAQERR